MFTCTCYRSRQKSKLFGVIFSFKGFDLLTGSCSYSVISKLVFQEKSYLFRTSLYLAASASAEFFADIALAPMEAVKVRIQTQPGWANTLREGAPKLWAEEGIRGYVD